MGGFEYVNNKKNLYYYNQMQTLRETDKYKTFEMCR